MILHGDSVLADWSPLRRFIATPILPESFIQSTGAQFKARGLDFAKTDDAVAAVMRLATDTSIHGMILYSGTFLLHTDWSASLRRTNTWGRPSQALSIGVSGPRPG